MNDFDVSSAFLAVVLSPSGTPRIVKLSAAEAVAPSVRLADGKRPGKSDCQKVHTLRASQDRRKAAAVSHPRIAMQQASSHAK